MMKRVWGHKHLPVVLLLTVALAVGLLTVRQYGESWDEADIYRYSRYAIDAYRYLLRPSALPAFDTNLNLYGPGYYMAAHILAAALTAIHPAWSLIVAWHALYLLTFLGASAVLYVLCTRWMSALGAFGATLLFISQPLLWGHAFINPKDIPFMAFFMASVLGGFMMIDHFGPWPKFAAYVLPAAILLGLTSSFRILGPLAGLLVLAYAVRKLRWHAIGPAIVYGAAAAATAYLAWPYLWGAPLARYIETINVMRNFPFAWPAVFAGNAYLPSQIPKVYFPTILAVQLTEPALALIALGLGLSAVRSMKHGITAPLALFLAWFLIPAALIIWSGSTLYDNARQLFFLLPPLFILTGVAFEKLLALLAHPAAKAGVLLIAAVPGIVSAARLHPYEYVYYNALVGGTGGAYGKYEMEYWGTSMREVAGFLNSSAPEGASVVVYGPSWVVADYARPDIQVHSFEEAAGASYDYIALMTRPLLDEGHCKDAATVFSVGRDGAVFSVLERNPAGSKCR